MNKNIILFSLEASLGLELNLISGDEICPDREETEEGEDQRPDLREDHGDTG